MAVQFAASATFLTSLLALATTLATCNTEGDILYKQRQVWRDANNVLESWDPTLVNPCTWLHITCNNDNSVIRVDLGNAGLSGSLIPDLGGLKNLRFLMLFENNLTGSIPSSLGNLKSLMNLELQKNALSGAIPASLGNIKTLQFLRLNGNMLTGKLPQEILSLVAVGNLSELNIANNKLDGTVRSSRPRVTAIIQDKLKIAT
ncbi:disease resistance protein BAK6 [Setaria viridis]|nr:leucine-rich repeat protein 1-like [Setaria viridis]